MSRPLKIAILSAALLLLATVPALAANGEGIAGETNDKIVTFFSLGVVLFFPLLILLLNVLHHRLEKRKEQRKAASARAGAGW